MYCDQVTTNTPHDSLRLLVETKDSVDAEGLKKEIAKIEAMQAGSAKGTKGGPLSNEILQFLYKIPDSAKEKADEKRGVVVKVPGCRVQKLPIRKDTQIALAEKKAAHLHMNKLSDYYGKTLLLCQAPKQTQFVDHWMALWQEKVRPSFYKIGGGYVRDKSGKLEFLKATRIEFTSPAIFSSHII